MPTTAPFAPEFTYIQVTGPIAAWFRAGRQSHRGQEVQVDVDLPTRLTRFRGRPAEAATLSRPYSRTASPAYVKSPLGTYAEETLRYGDTPEPTSEMADDDNRSPGERVRQHDPGPLPATAPDANQAPTAELAPGSPKTPVSGDGGSRPVGSPTAVGPHGIREVVREEIQQAYWSAPLPPPEALEQYDKVVPGMAERILSLTERVLTGKIDILEKLANKEILAAKIGIIVAFGLTLLAFAASVAFFALSKQVAGLAFLSFPVVMLIRSFLFRSDRNDSVDDYDAAISPR